MGALKQMRKRVRQDYDHSRKGVNKMDTGKGHFEIIEGATKEDIGKNLIILEAKYPEHGGVFEVGELVELKGSWFRVTGMKRSEMTLKLVKKGDQNRRHGR